MQLSHRLLRTRMYRKNNQLDCSEVPLQVQDCPFMKPNRPLPDMPSPLCNGWNQAMSQACASSSPS
jgi:hypothetical protein